MAARKENLGLRIKEQEKIDPLTSSDIRSHHGPDDETAASGGVTPQGDRDRKLLKEINDRFLAPDDKKRHINTSEVPDDKAKKVLKIITDRPYDPLY